MISKHLHFLFNEKSCILVFRKAMDYIVFNKNNDEIFDKNLTNKSGRAASQHENVKPESKKKFMSSFSIMER